MKMNTTRRGALLNGNKIVERGFLLPHAVTEESESIKSLLERVRLGSESPRTEYRERVLLKCQKAPSFKVPLLISQTGGTLSTGNLKKGDRVAALLKEFRHIRIFIPNTNRMFAIHYRRRPPRDTRNTLRPRRRLRGRLIILNV